MERGAKVSGSRFGYRRRRRRAARAGALPLRARPVTAAGPHAGAAAGARARGGDVRHRLLPDREGRISTRCPRTGSTSSARPRCRWPRSTWARSSTSCRSATARSRRASAARPARRQGHARHVPRAPVRQGRDVRLLRAGGLAGRARAAARDRGGARPGARAAVPRRQHRRRRPRRAAAKKYDIEAWFPSQARYREITSTLEHDRLPGAPARHPLPPARGQLEHAAHAERHGGHRRARCSRSSRTSRTATCSIVRAGGARPSSARPARARRSAAIELEEPRRGAGAVERGGLENR